MITKINQLKETTQVQEVKALCESTISAISSAIYNGVTPDAQLEIERVALTNLFEGLTKYTSDKEIAKWLVNQKRVYALKHLGVRKAVNTLMEKEAKLDITLQMVLEDFRDKLETTPEVLLYEAFISAMSGFSQLRAVDTELSALASQVKQYKNDIDITKIIEVMKETRSNYLIPLIEDVVDNYLSDKTEQSKSSLKETLIKFSYDPFVHDILNALMLDATQLQLEYSNAECDIEDKLFSPILYLGENEALFNVHGTYYVKKNNYVNKLKKEDVGRLDEAFTTLCDTINLPNIEVSRKDIKVYIGDDNAVLTENETYVNGGIFTVNQINESAAIAEWGGNTQFYKTLAVLRENFDEIAELDFVKRVYLKENTNYAADVFKLRDNIFITTFDPINNKSTFYRNINPIQAEKIMMEHMRFDVSKTFAEILPNKERILSEIDSTKREYTDYIHVLEGKIEQFSNETGKAATEVVNALVEELNDIKNDYKNYLNKVESFTDVSENLNITVQDDSSGKSYTVVVPTGAMAAKGEEGGAEGDSNVEGDDFGTEVGMANMTAPGSAGGASSAVTFDDDDSEMLSDEPSEDGDKVDLGADDLEAYADKVDAEAELENPQGEEEAGVEGGGDTGAEPEAGVGGGGTAPAEGGEGLDLGDSGSSDTAELDLGLDEPAGKEGDTEENGEKPSEKPGEKKEAAGPPEKNLERTNFNKDANPDDLEEPKKIKKVFLKRPKKDATKTQSNKKI
jgi:hypothetical protein